MYTGTKARLRLPRTARIIFRPKRACSYLGRAWQRRWRLLWDFIAAHPCPRCHEHHWVDTTVYPDRTPTLAEFNEALAECLRTGAIVMRPGPDGEPLLYHPDHAPPLTVPVVVRREVDHGRP